MSLVKYTTFFFSPHPSFIKPPHSSTVVFMQHSVVFTQQYNQYLASSPHLSLSLKYTVSFPSLQSSASYHNRSVLNDRQVGYTCIYLPHCNPSMELKMNIVLSDHDLHPAYQTACGNSAFDYHCLTVNSFEDFLNMYDGCAFE